MDTGKVFDVDHTIHAWAMALGSFGDIATFARVNKRFARVLASCREDIYRKNLRAGSDAATLVFGEPFSVDDEPAYTAGKSLRWCRRYKLHRDGDKPATVSKDGTKRKWYQNGQLHRDGGQPAYISDSVQIWYQYGDKHRDGDEPAALIKRLWLEDYDVYWYKRGLLHRDGDQPAIVYADGDEQWYSFGHLHRDGDKPSVVCKSGEKRWHQHGRAHRDNGPAIIHATGLLVYIKYGREVRQ